MRSVLTILKDILGKINILNKNKIEIVKLWENASPTSTFASQTLDNELAENPLDYDFIGILAQEMTSSSVRRLFIMRADKDYQIHIAFPWVGGASTRVTNRVRRATLNNNGTINFSAAYYASYEAGEVVSNESCIPIAIYGIKGVQ